MNPQSVVNEADKKFSAGVERLKDELKKLRTGRASSTMLDSIMVTAYGTPMPLNQVATVTVPEAQLLQISPFDPSNIQAISNAIRDNKMLGLNPMDDGRIVRVPIPALTEERRRDITKIVSQKQEEAMIALRSVRHDAMDTVAKMKKDKEVGEDDAKRIEKQIDDAMTKAKNDVEATAKSKEQEIMTL